MTKAAQAVPVPGLLKSPQILNWQVTMGFEQLAALKAQLAKQAKEARPAKQAKEARPAKQANEARPAKPPRARVDAAAKPANAGKPVDPVIQAIGKLQKRFPLAFPKNPAPKVPLKVGIFEDLLQHAASLALDEAMLREAVRTWCRGTRYWTCMVEGATRLDLAGEPAGQVTLADAKRAQQQRSQQHRASRAQKAKQQPAAGEVVKSEAVTNEAAKDEAAKPE
jgi:ProP effector